MLICKQRFALNLITLSLIPFCASAASPWQVNDGTTLQVDTDYRTGMAKDNPLRADGVGSRLITNPYLNFTTTADSTHAAFITGGAALELNKSILFVQGMGSHAIAADNGTVKINSGNIATAGAHSHGVTATNGSAIEMKDVYLSIGGSSGKGIALDNSTLNADGITIISSANSAVGIGLKAGSVADISNVSIDLHSNTASHGLEITSSQLTGNNVAVTSNGKRMPAVLVDGTAGGRATLNLTNSSVTSVATGILAHAAGTELTAVDVTTTGAHSYALDINDAATAQLNGGTFLTAGTGAHAVRTVSTNSVLNAEGVTFQTTGESASAVHIRNGQAVIKDSTLTTQGKGSTALYSDGKTTAERLKIATSGEGAHGVIAAGAVNTLTLNNSTVTTTGNKGAGLVVSGQGTLMADGVNVTTSGEGAHLLYAQGGKLTARNGTMNASGHNAAGLYAFGYPNRTNSVGLDNITLTSDNGFGIFSAAGKLDLALSNNTTVSGGNGFALWAATATDSNGVAHHAQVAVEATGNVSLLGDVATDSYNNRIDLSLAKNSLLNGATKNVNQLMIDGTSRWLMTESSNLQTLKHAGNIDFKAGGNFKTLTVDGELSGSGQFTMNTQLGDDSSPTDRLLVKGDASGNFDVVINNQNGMGAKTVAGIPVILVSGNAQSATFNQKNTVVAGNYEYYLNKVNDHDWYLQASYTPVPVPPAPTPDPAPAPDPAPGSDGNKTWRPETAGYLIAPYLNAAYGFNSVGTWHERLGATQGSGSTWGRVYSRHDRLDANRFGYQVNTSFLQLGGDLLHKERDGWQIKAGPTITLGQQRSNNRDSARLLRPGLSADTGKTESVMAGVGGYLSAWNSDGTYLDSVLQATRYGNKYKSMSDAKQTSYGVVLSGEAGKPFALTDHLKLEPQLQLMGQYMNISQTRANGVKLNDQNLFTGRARSGLRLFWDTPDFVPYLQADVIQQLGPTPGIKMNGERLRPDLQKSVWQAGVGLSGRLTPALSLYAEAKYSHSFGKGHEGYLGNAGVKYQF